MSSERISADPPLTGDEHENVHRSVLSGAFFIGMSHCSSRRDRRVRQHVHDGSRKRQGHKDGLLRQYQIQGKTYCFGNQSALTQFMADPSGNLTKAQAYYSKRQPG